MSDASKLATWRGTEPTPFWLDTPNRPAPHLPLEGDGTSDLTVVGGGFTGLWTALLAKERDPGRRVTLLEGHRIAWAASGRNGGFCSASLTHGEENGRRHFPEDYERIHELGIRNLDEIAETVVRYRIPCDFHRNGTLSVATEEWQIPHEEGALDADGTQAEINSPRFLGAVWNRSESALVDPAQLAWGLARACLNLGVVIHENTPVTSIEYEGDDLTVRTRCGTVRTSHVALATNAFRPLLRRLRLYTIPVYDYAIVTEPLSSHQIANVGWTNRQGLSERANQFHYSRLTSDDRILWGGYDAIYHYRRGLKSAFDQRFATFDRLGRQFLDTFPQLRGVNFTHAWGGPIDTCTRFCAFYGTAMHDRVTYALGFTGLGVGSSRFAGNVMLDLLDGAPTERTSLSMVRRRPVPFPPEPAAYAGIAMTKRSLAKADVNGGRRNAWLRALDGLGLGFDS